jgi:hypothetical protein
MPLGIATPSLVTRVIYITSRKMDGSLSVHALWFSPCIASAYWSCWSRSTGNYDISKMHYDGPGNVPGAPGGGYGYDIRVEGKSSANPPEAPPAVAAAA